MMANAAGPSEGGDPMSTTHENSRPKSRIRYIGALPLINRVIKRLRLRELLATYVPADKRDKVAPADTLLIMMCNVLISREPLYRMEKWAKSYDSGLLGLPSEKVKYLNEDRFGRALDKLFRSDFRSLTTNVVVTAVDEYELETDQVHNDGTAQRFIGQYLEANGEPALGKETHRITFGHPKKDGRPDLKQLLYILTTTADGHVPIWVNVDHGNTADVKTHIRTWNSIRKVNGTADFLYVGDCKVCSDENLAYIDQHGGRFLSVLPANWSEHKQFHELLRNQDVAWTDVVTRKSKRRKTDKPTVYVGYESPEGMHQGYRLLWFRSSQKEADDRAARDRIIQRAQQKLQEIREKIGQPYSRLTTREKIMDAAQKVLREHKVEQWLKVDVVTKETKHEKKTGPGRPGPKSTYVLETQVQHLLQWEIDAVALQREARSDGVFPLVTNDRRLSMLDALDAYKCQPMIEKRFEQLKTAFKLRPVLLQSHLRIEAFLILYFFVLLVASLIEREARRLMQEQGLKVLPIYAEGEDCAAPTARGIFDLFRDVHRMHAVDKYGRVVDQLYGELSDAQLAVLELHEISAKEYMTAGEDIS
jgi:transposase